MKTLRPRINRITNLPIYDQPIEHRINNTFRELTGLTKSQATKALTTDKLSDNWRNEIKDVLFAVKLAGIRSSMSNLQLT